MGPNRLEDRSAAVEADAAIDDQTERLLEAAAVIAEDLREIGRDPIVVGGLAVAYWAEGVEMTEDIDVAMLDHDRLAERLEALGLET
jgi:predicted dinucleotide-binding enzyme